MSPHNDEAGRDRFSRDLRLGETVPLCLSILGVCQAWRYSGGSRFRRRRQRN